MRLQLIISFAIAGLSLGAVVSRVDPPAHEVATPENEQPVAREANVRPALAAAPEPERKVVDHLLKHDSWPRRAVGLMRLERYGCGDSRDRLRGALSDPAWQVRAFAIRALRGRNESIEPHALDQEDDPRVLRAALRNHFSCDLERLGRGVRVLVRSADLTDKMLAVELAAASGDEALGEIARETARQIILKMDRVAAGVLSARLAAVTGTDGIRRHYEWQNWLLKKGRRFELQPALAHDAGTALREPCLIAQLESDAFVGLESYMNTLGDRQLDLAIVLDCTASMWGEITATQAGIDDLMRFVGDIVSSARIAVVAYRDRRDEFETRAWDFNSDIEAARRQLWTLTAEGGGDFPEAVYPAMKLAFTKLKWRADATKVLILVGDAPPHVGLGAQCVELAARARAEAEVSTHAIEAEAKPVKHFADIAKAGGGRCVSLEDDDALVAEIAGLTLADRYEPEFREFFEVYLELCR